jgi:hypothetical protein
VTYFVVGFAKVLQGDGGGLLLFRPRHGVQDIELVVLEDFDPKLMHSESTNPISEAGYPDRILDSEFRETDVDVGKGEDQVFFILSRLLRKIPGKLNEAALLSTHRRGCKTLRVVPRNLIG